MSLILPQLMVPSASVLGMSDSLFTDFKPRTTSESTWTQTGVNFGTPAVGRILVVGVMCPNNGGPTVDSMTIGGVTATLAKAAARTGKMFYAVVPAGESGTVETVFSTAIANKYLGAWALYGASATQPSASATTTTNGGALGINVLANSFVCAMSGDEVGTTCTTAGLTEDFDDNSAGTTTASGASDYFASAVTPQAITMTMASSAFYRGISAAFQPA
tara:strand:- start:7126 stop:7779 length:654 start_codon:yes stop_codon:yes gene_type:complete